MFLVASLVSSLELNPSHDSDISALQKLEGRLLPVLDTFISEKEDHLKELEGVLRRTSALRKMSASEIGKYLGNPLNQYFVVKRFVEDWGRLEDYIKSDSSSQGRWLLTIFYRGRVGNDRSVSETWSNMPFCACSSSWKQASFATALSPGPFPWLLVQACSQGSGPDPWGRDCSFN